MTQTVCYFQEASSELEVVNIDGKTTGALTVRTSLLVKIFMYVPYFLPRLLLPINRRVCRRS